MRNRNRTFGSPLVLMALTIFIDFTGFGLVIPLLPFWAERLGAGPRAIGALLAAYALAQILFTPMLGALSDRFGRKPIILLSLVVEGAAFALTALSGSLALLFVARFVGGLGASNIGSAQAVVADVTPREGRARAMGVIGAAIGLGFVVGPALGGALAALGEAVPFWVAMGVALVNAVLVWRLLPETRRRRVAETTVPTPTARVRDALVAGWGRALRRPGVARLVAINLLYTVAFTGMETVFVLLTQRTFGWTARQNGFLFAYVGVVIVVMQGGVVGQVVKGLGERRVLIAGMALLAAGLILLPWSGTLALVLGALGLVSVGDGAVTPALAALLSLASPADAQGETLGVAQGAGAFGRLVGPLAAGALFAAGTGLPFIFGAAVVILGALLAIPTLPSAPTSRDRTARGTTRAADRDVPADATPERAEARATELAVR
ncbi:MAG TPA: MFS transporter [Ktedonobacterales bacterium]